MVFHHFWEAHYKLLRLLKTSSLFIESLFYIVLVKVVVGCIPSCFAYAFNVKIPKFLLFNIVLKVSK